MNKRSFLRRLLSVLGAGLAPGTAAQPRRHVLIQVSDLSTAGSESGRSPRHPLLHFDGRASPGKAFDEFLPRQAVMGRHRPKHGADKVPTRNGS